MIKSAALKLTLYYLAIIMAISIGFSLVLYRVSSSEIRRGFRRPAEEPYMSIIRERGNIEEFERSREAQLIEGYRHLQLDLLVLNLATLSLGGGLSYLLARRTLAPIEAALEAQSRFAADASHELRTPLTAMQTEIEVALRSSKLTSASAREVFASNLEEVAKLRTLSEALLRLARQNGMDFAPKPISVAEVVTEVEKRMAKLAKARRITLVSKVNGIKVAGDESSLIELLSILVENAIKYSPAKTTVQIKAYSSDGYGYISVHDEGIGIAEKDRPHIFERFYRADSSRTKNTADGYGLGLSIAEKIVEMHHGSIEVQSKPNSGSTFIVKLPRA